MAQPPVTARDPQTVRIGVLQDGWPPFSIVQDGQVSGIGVDFLRAALRDRPVRFVTTMYADMPALLAAACANKVDVVMNLGESAERARCLRFSNAYFDANVAIVGRKGAVGQQAVALERARIAVEPGFIMDERLRARFPSARFESVKDTEDGLRAVSAGKADYYPTMQPVADYYLGRPEFKGLAVQASYREPGGGLHFAFSPAAATLHAAVNHGLATMPQDVRRAVIGRWVTPPLVASSPAGEFFLTPEEQAFLQSLPVLKVAFDAGSAPYSYVDNSGRPGGMAADYLSYLGRTLGVRFQRERAAPFAQSVEALRQGKLDLMAVAVGEDPALAGLSVTRPYASFPMVIVGRQLDVAVEGLNDLAGKRVVVCEASGVEGLLKAAVPHLQLSVVSSVHAGMEAVANGKADAYVDDLATVDVELQRYFAGTLRIIGSGRQTLDMGFGLSPELAARLLPLIDRAMEYMPEGERLAIQSRYIAANYALEPSWQQVLRRIGPYLAAVIVFIGILLRSQYRLRREASARRLAKQQLQAQLDFQRTLIDAVPIPITVKDAQGRYTEVNAAYQLLAGMTRQQMVGHLPTELNVRGNRAAETLEAGSRRALETRQLQQFAVDYPDADGLTRHFLCWAQPITHGGPEFDGLISAAVDVTEIRNAEAKARAAEAMLVDVTRHLPATVYQVLERDGAFLYRWVSGNAQQLLDRTPESLIGQTNPTLYTHSIEERTRLLAAMNVAKMKQEPLSEDLRCLIRGQTRWIRVHAVPRTEPDGSVLWHGYYADLTEDRERAEVLAQAKDAAEAASRAKDSFLAMMSHEIRTPMNGILGLIELLQKTPLTAEQQRMVGLAGESGQALGRILDDILDYAKLEAGRLDILRAPVDLRELFDGVLGSLLPQAFQKGLRLKQRVSAEVAAIVQADGIRLRQILFNLLGNAIKFTDHGSVTLHATMEPGATGLPMLVVAVEDTGIGIARADLARLFAPFMQSERSTARRFGGTGLGLTIVRTLAELMDGEISLKSEAGVGTTAVLRVPCEVVNQGYDLPNLSGRALSVLVSDDSRRAALIAYGEAAGMRCISSEDETPDDGIAIIDRMERAGRKGQIAIHLTDELLPLGYSQDESGVSLGSNPLRWTAFVGALEALLKGMAPASPQASRAGAVNADDLVPQGARILVVEDHPINREVIGQQLRLLGYRSTVCTNGQEAVTALEADTYDLVLTDCHMPVMDGFDLTRSIRASDRPSVRELPVVGLTATVAREEHLLCMEVGMNAFLVKPATLASLQQTIETALQGGPEAPSPETEVRSPEAAPTRRTPESGGCRPERIDTVGLRSQLEPMLAEHDVRQIFLRSLEQDRDALRAELAAPTPAGLGKWCHRAGGAISVMEQPYLHELLDRLDGLLETGSPAQIQSAGASLSAMYDYLIDWLEKLDVA
ncbi:transporter substrate-binding domain-containing protein [Cupriavidus metallidurans]|uniref:Virulence sensor protein BvgS n=1 Tax=Cupriavidus metallidurans TaxID=119219 RepID=A0A2L0XCC6_9BURK|nr:PAS domain S-box protein [Cupriavidus metallidurans]KWR75364.1 histidine kinase [Cupriavidus sp. SHE]QBP14091.1 transporter substrate-binding domain-containing protein [Cupriavidus metallidurans]QWC92558.1 transporter substrate-binding domain-containing protein [Cupriavidus metallidurans]